MLKTNEFICNGKRLTDLPFYVVCEVLAPPTRSDKKNILTELPFVNGVVVQDVDAYSTVPKEYAFYLHDVTSADVRKFKAFFPDRGEFTPYDEPDLRFIYESVHLSFSVLDNVGGYEVTATFTCQPFAYEEEKTMTLGSTITNHTNAPMHPKLKITGKTGSETYLKIGEQVMRFKEIQDVIYIECKHRHQDAYSSGGRKVNNEVKGDFFEIPVGIHRVEKGQGISSVEITTRWCWR